MNPSPMTTAERELQALRFDFEQWGRGRFTLTTFQNEGRYHSEAAQCAWLGYQEGIRQARAGAPREPTPELAAMIASYKEWLREGDVGPNIMSRQLDAIVRIALAPSPPGPSDEANQGAQPVAFKERLSEILMAAINKNDRYTFDGGHYIRWGAVERDILAAYAFRAPDTQVAPSPPPDQPNVLPERWWKSPPVAPDSLVAMEMPNSDNVVMVDRAYLSSLESRLERVTQAARLLDEAVALLRNIDRHGVLSMATQKGAGEFIRKYDAIRAETPASQAGQPADESRKAD